MNLTIFQERKHMGSISRIRRER